MHAYSFMLGLVVMLICSSLSLYLSGGLSRVGWSVSQSIDSSVGYAAS